MAFDVVGQVAVVAEELLGVLAALSEPGVAGGEPGAALHDPLVLDAEVDQLADAGDAFAVVDVELGDAEGRGDLVLDHLDADPRADDLVAVLERGDAPDVDANGRVELERTAAGGGLGRTEHDADLLPDLVDEDERRPRLGDDRGQLAERLGHEPRLQADVGVAHLAFELGPRHERGDRVDHDDVERVRAHEHLGDLERLLAAVRLRNEEFVDVDADLLRVLGVEGVLGIDEGGGAAGPLGLPRDREGQRRLSARLGAVDLDHAAPRETAGSDGMVDGERSGRNRLDAEVLLFTEAHDRALAELPFDLGERARDGLVAAGSLLCVRAALLHGLLSPE